MNLPYISLGGINDIAPKNDSNSGGASGDDLDEKMNDSGGGRGGKNGNFLDISDINRNKGKTPIISKIYGKTISKQMSKIEGLLKTVAARHGNLQTLAETFKSIMYDSQRKVYANVLDLQKICDIKGLKSADVRSVTLSYNRMVPHSQQMKQSIIDVEATKTDLLRDLGIKIKGFPFE